MSDLTVSSDPPRATMLMRQKNYYFTFLWYTTSILFLKSAVLAQCYRVIDTSRLRKFCFGAVLLIGAWTTTQLLLAIFVCNPIEGFWNFDINADCMPSLTQWYQNAAGNIISNIIILSICLACVSHMDLLKFEVCFPELRHSCHKPCHARSLLIFLMDSTKRARVTGEKKKKNSRKSLLVYPSSLINLWRSS